MSEKSKESLYQKQKNTRPKIEEVIDDVLSGDALKTAQGFVAYLKENKMSLQWASANSWAINFKSKRVGYFRLSGTAHYYYLGDNSWHIAPHIDYNTMNDLEDETLNETVWANIRYCKHCSKCSGSRRKILGKEFDDVCHMQVVFNNPDTKTIEYIKRLMEISKIDISNPAI